MSPKHRRREFLSWPRSHSCRRTGLEFFYDFVEPDIQMQSLRGHLDLAEELCLPLILHCREAEQVLYDELKGRSLPAGGVVHCFTGDWSWAQRFPGLGFHLGVTGMVTFKKDLPMKETARRCPLERLLVETDGPYLAPVPHRGRTTIPSNPADRGPGGRASRLLGGRSGCRDRP